MTQTILLLGAVGIAWYLMRDTSGAGRGSSSDGNLDGRSNWIDSGREAVELGRGITSLGQTIAGLFGGGTTNTSGAKGKDTGYADAKGWL